MMISLMTASWIFGLGAATHLALDAVRDRKKPSSSRGRGLIAHKNRRLQMRLPRRPVDVEILTADETETVLANSLPLAGLGLGSALAGLINPALYLPSILVSGYLVIPFLRDGMRKFQRNGHLLDLVDSALLPLLLALGNITAVALLLFVISSSRRVLSRTYDRSRKRLANVFGDLPKRVWILSGDSEIEVDTRSLKAGDIVVVGSGETVPVDGVITFGEALVDQHMLTGESLPAEKMPGDRTFATSLVVSGRLLIRVEQSGAKTHASEVSRLILQASDRRLRVQERGEAVAERSLPVMLGLATIAGIIGGLTRAVTVYMVTPGYTMRVLAPMALLRSLQQATESGIFIKDGRSLELLGDVDTVVFDKTGTLTDGSLRVAKVLSIGSIEPRKVLAMAAAAEGRQGHPIAQAIRQAAKDLPMLTVDRSEYVVGRGIQAGVDGRSVLVGTAAFLNKNGAMVGDDVLEQVANLSAVGMMCVLVAIDNEVSGLIVLDQSIRPNARQTVAALRRRGLETVIISGDTEESTRHIAEKCGVDRFFAGTLPSEKADLIRKMQEEGKTVCFIGDGINDAGALKQSHVSLSIRGSSTIAVDTAQVVLLQPDLALVPKLLNVSEAYEGSTEFAARAAVWLPLVALPTIMLGYGGVFLLIAAHQAAFWSGLGRILTVKPQDPPPGEPPRADPLPPVQAGTDSSLEAGSGIKSD